MAEQQSPGALEHGVHRQPVLAGVRGEIGQELFGQSPDVATGQAGGGRGTAARAEVGRLVESRQQLLPGGECLLPVLVGNPVQEVAVLHGRGERPFVGVACIQVRQVPNEQRQGPAVDDQVVDREDEPMTGVAASDQREAEQRRVGGVEGPAAFLVGDGLGLGLRRGCHLAPRHLGVPYHDLHRRARPAEPERAAQTGVPVDQRLRGSPQPVRVEWALEVEEQLDHVEPARRLVAPVQVGVVEQALLQGPEGQDLLDPPGGCFPVGRCFPAGGHARSSPAASSSSNSASSSCGTVTSCRFLGRADAEPAAESARHLRGVRREGGHRPVLEDIARR